MELIRMIIFSAALLFLIGVSGIIYTGNFIETQTLFSNFSLILIALVLLIFAAYLLLKYDIKLQLKKLFLEKSDEATLVFLKNELTELKKYLNEVKKIDRRNVNKIFKEVKLKLEKLVPYKVYLSSIFAESDFIENMNKILSIEKLNSKDISEFSLAIKKIKEELAEI